MNNELALMNNELALAEAWDHLQGEGPYDYNNELALAEAWYDEDNRPRIPSPAPTDGPPF